jgi:hypothetical protein
VDTKNTNRVLEILEEAGTKSLVEVHCEKSHLALSQFLKEGSSILPLLIATIESK